MTVIVTVADNDPTTPEKAGLVERHRAWLRWVCTHTGHRPSRLAALAKVSDTTITRLLNDPDYRYALSSQTIERIRRSFDVPGPEDFHSHGRLHEADAILPGSAHMAMLAPFLAEYPRTAWQLHSDRLTRAGYLPGDFLIVDNSVAPKLHNIVCCTVDGEVVFRLYDPPFLVSAGDGPPVKPLLIDGHRVHCQGVVIASIRLIQYQPA